MIFQLPDIPLNILFQFWGIASVIGYLYTIVRLLPKINKEKVELNRITTKTEEGTELRLQKPESVQKLLDFELKLWALILSCICFIIGLLTVSIFFFLYVELDLSKELIQNTLNFLGWSYLVINLIGIFIFLRIIMFNIQISHKLTEILMKNSKN